MSAAQRIGSLLAALLGICVGTLLGVAWAAEPGSTSLDSSQEAAGVLQRFAGEWSTHTQIRHLDPPIREFETRSEATCRATLEGQYFEFRTQSIPPGDADLQTMTYDAAAHLYRQWVFSSDGYRHEATGSWDPATSTLRWTGQTGDATFVIDDRWDSADELDWTLERRDAGGKLTQTIRGRVSRAKR